jgi:hypothetical protein
VSRRRGGGVGEADEGSASHDAANHGELEEGERLLEPDDGDDKGEERGTAAENGVGLQKEKAGEQSAISRSEAGLQISSGEERGTAECQMKRSEGKWL